MSTRFQRLLPVLPVRELDREVGFYKRLGFTASQTVTGFTALQHGDVLFGVQASDAPVPRDFAWQIEAGDLDATYADAVAGGLAVDGPVRAHPAGFRFFEMTTPSGWRLRLEGR